VGVLTIVADEKALIISLPGLLVIRKFELVVEMKAFVDRNDFKWHFQVKNDCQIDVEAHYPAHVI
jgi:hypothetical protein